MRLPLVDHWCLILKRAWSFRLAALTGVLSALEIIVPYFADSMPRGIFAAAAVVSSTAASIARVIPQRNLGDE